MLGSHEIGLVTKAALVAGQAEVEVQLFREFGSALPTGAVFVASTDAQQPDRSLLRVYDLSTIAPELQPIDGKYAGFRNVLELAFVVGADKAQKIWQGLADLNLPASEPPASAPSQKQ